MPGRKIVVLPACGEAVDNYRYGGEAGGVEKIHPAADFGSLAVPGYGREPEPGS